MHIHRGPKLIDMVDYLCLDFWHLSSTTLMCCYYGLCLFEIVSGFEFSKGKKLLLSNCVIHQQEFINEDNIIFRYFYITNIFAGNQWTYLRTVTFIPKQTWIQWECKLLLIYCSLLCSVVQWIFSKINDFVAAFVLSLGNLAIDFSNICFLKKVSTAILYYKKHQSATKFLLLPGANRGLKAALQSNICNTQYIAKLNPTLSLCYQCIFCTHFSVFMITNSRNIYTAENITFPISPLRSG